MFSDEYLKNICSYSFFLLVSPATVLTFANSLELDQDCSGSKLLDSDGFPEIDFLKKSILKSTNIMKIYPVCKEVKYYQSK